uniref:DNA-binding protein S1FA2 n=3 Tax=Aegilops tauschii subsp. strangulata TaxID=200361 RepID=A0A453BXB5_AEGTS
SQREGEEGAVPGPDLVAAMAEQFAESANNVIIEEVNKGLNPGMIVLLVVATTLLLFFVGNYALYLYAQKTLPPKKKKPVSKKKLKREKLKQGVSAPGE